MAAGVRCDGRPMFVPQDEFSAWAWLPLGVRRDVTVPAPSIKSVSGADQIRFAVGKPGPGVTGFRRTHRQALNAQAVALAAGPSGQLVTSFGEVAPLALMSGSIDLLRDWVIETLGTLADHDEHNARLRDTLRVFLQENGSLQSYGGASAAAQEHRPVPGAQGRGRTRAAHQPGPPAHGARLASGSVARRSGTAPGWRSRIARISHQAQQASRMVSSWISTAIFAKADAYCLLWCAQNSNSRRLGSRTRT
jgi:hypothetical protein